MRFEAWSSANGTEVCVATEAQARELRAAKSLGDYPKLMYSIEASTWEEAMAVHHIRMGWEPYQPSGEAQPCPHKCGALYYPQGSGFCRNCGRVS